MIDVIGSTPVIRTIRKTPAKSRGSFVLAGVLVC
nr:MAG TPA: hypothetical protein [Caudoviricetes sp.]